MLILLRNDAYIVGVEGPAMDLIKKHLTINNPMFIKRAEMGFWTGDLSRHLQYYSQKSDTAISVPIGALADILEILQNASCAIEKEDIIDNRVSNLKPGYFNKYKFTGQLRDYQQKIVDICMEKTVGHIEAMTGSGKTITFVDLTMRRKEPTLILVNTIELANQTIEAFVKFTDLPREGVGFIGSGKFSLYPVTVALHQTMAKMPDLRFDVINERIGQIIADEVHICAANTYFNTMSKLKAKYKFGFSATPERDDGLTEVITFASGPKIHTVDTKHLENVLIKPDVRYIETAYNFPLMSSEEYVALMGDLAENQERNQLIIDTWNTDYKNKYTAILCTRLAQVGYLQEQFGDIAVSLHSKMKKKARKAAMKSLQDGTKYIVISTYGLFSTGIDLPRLEVLFFAAPIRSKVKVRQAAGRLMRMSKGKTSATIVDFVDSKLDILKYQSYARKRVFRNLMNH